MKPIYFRPHVTPIKDLGGLPPRSLGSFPKTTGGEVLATPIGRSRDEFEVASFCGKSGRGLDTQMLYVWNICQFIINVGKYSIHGAFGIDW